MWEMEGARCASSKRKPIVIEAAILNCVRASQATSPPARIGRNVIFPQARASMCKSLRKSATLARHEFAVRKTYPDMSRHRLRAARISFGEISGCRPPSDGLRPRWRSW